MLTYIISFFIYVDLYSQHVACLSYNGCEGDENGKYCTYTGIEPTSLAFWACVLVITPLRLPDFTTLPTPTCLCDSLPERSVQTTTLTITPHRLPDFTTLPTPPCICDSLPESSVQPYYNSSVLVGITTSAYSYRVIACGIWTGSVACIPMAASTHKGVAFLSTLPSDARMH